VIRSLHLFTALALAVAVALAVAASPFASGAPDGLERVAQHANFLDAGRLHPLQERSPVPGYVFPGVGHRMATGAAGFVGTVGVFALGLGLAWLLRRRASARPTAARPNQGP
jgi:hypothetical protein